jgi:hypothetical protein
MGQTYVYNTGKAEEEEGTYQLQFGVFIDGTLNNKDNSRVRKVAENTDKNDNETATAEEIAAYKKAVRRDLVDKAFGLNKKEGTSYYNDYSNVARKWGCCDINYRIYVEGMGTENLESDAKEGYAFGSGLTGVRAKVRKACDELSKKVLKRKKEKGGDILTRITLDVFGFSRGATSARNFVNEVNVQKAYPAIKGKIPNGYRYIVAGSREYKEPIYRDAIVDRDGIEIDESLLVNGKLPKMGYFGYCLLKNGVLTPEELDDLRISIRVLGVYDTVSSYYERGAMATYDQKGNLKDDEFTSKTTHILRNKFDYRKNIEELGLNNLGSVQKPVHFTAKDEHRENFSLTRLPIGIEKNFPGVHCDIGGSYENGPEENDDLENTWNLLFPDLQKYMQELIDGHWFNDEEIKIPFFSATSHKIKTERKMVRKEYSYIPLHFMERFCKQTAMADMFILSTEDKYDILIKEEEKEEDKQILLSAKSHLERYVFEDGEEWEYLPEEIYQQRKKEREAKRRAEELKKELEKPIVQKPVYDNLDPALYRPKGILSQIPLDPPKPNIIENSDGTKTHQLEEIVVVAYTPDTLLRKLRNKYFHWSATRASFGKDPNMDRKRAIY